MASIGLYGVTSYAVNLRRSGIGIRMALGAHARIGDSPRAWRVSLLIGTGIVAGPSGRASVSRFVAELLYGLQPGDPVTPLAAATLALVAAVAGWLPANRASRLDPTLVLHDGCVPRHTLSALSPLTYRWRNGNDMPFCSDPPRHLW